jgi:hypothetical protein
MLQIRRPVYFEHFKKHVKDLEKHLDEGDYIQAAEKVWGAISSFVNAFSSQEAKKVVEKKQSFALLYRKLINKDMSLDLLLKKNFKSINEMSGLAYGLHIYFYGGSRKYSENYLKDIITRCANILKKIYSEVISENLNSSSAFS